MGWTFSMNVPATKSELTASHEELMRELRDTYVPCIQSSLLPAGGLTFVILYGSRARGDYSWQSDADLIICSPAFEGVRVLDRFDLISTCSFSAAVEPVCYTPQEALRALNRGRLTILDALHEGLCLFDDGCLLPDLRARFEDLKARGCIKRRRILGKIIWDLRGRN